MFNSQHWKIKLVYIGVGSLFGCLCTIVGMLASPATAQKNKFQEIECTKLTLIDPLTGKTTVKLETDEYGGYVTVYGAKHDRILAGVGVTGDGESGLMYVKRYTREKRIGGAEIEVNKFGGRLEIFGKVDGESRAVVGINQYGNGAVSTWDKNGYRQ